MHKWNQYSAAPGQQGVIMNQDLRQTIIFGLAEIRVIQYSGSIPGVSHIFSMVWIIIPACLIKQPNSTLSRMYVQTYISV